MQQTIKRYEDLLHSYAQQTDLDEFRRQHFQHWCSNPEACCYCISQSTWAFFGFIPRPHHQILCIAVTQKKEFLYLKIETEKLQKRIDGQAHMWNIKHTQPWQNALLDFSIAHPLFLQQFAWKRIPASLDLWDENRIAILVAQLSRPLGRLGSDPETALSTALFSHLDKEILRLMARNFAIATLGEYQFLWESRDTEELRIRMESLQNRRAIVPRFLVGNR